MYRSTILTALVASAAAHQVAIHNNCGAPAYIWSCGSEVSQMYTLESGGEPWTEDFYVKYDNGKPTGPSIYVSNGTSHTAGNIAQLEYYWEEAVNKVWWDLSIIKGDPFGDKAVSLGSDLNPIPYDACKPVQCSGVGKCANIYHTEDQLEGTHDCPPSNLVMKLCDDSDTFNAGDDSSNSDNSDNSAASSQAAPAPAPVSTEAAPSYTIAPAPAETPEAAATPAPAPPAQNNEPAANVHTAYATTIVTKVVSVNAQPSGVYVGDDGVVHANKKREAHAHAHAGAHKGRKRHEHFKA